MTRLEFLKVFLAALILKKLPRQMLLPMPRELYQVKTYSLGFVVSEEMLKDDYYGIGLSEQLASSQRELMDIYMKGAA